MVVVKKFVTESSVFLKANYTIYYPEVGNTSTYSGCPRFISFWKLDWL
jgi:hypothetical protein